MTITQILNAGVCAAFESANYMYLLEYIKFEVMIANKPLISSAYTDLQVKQKMGFKIQLTTVNLIWNQLLTSPFLIAELGDFNARWKGW